MIQDLIIKQLGCLPPLNMTVISEYNLEHSKTNNSNKIKQFSFLKELQATVKLL